MLWVSEGFTSYYEDPMLARSGRMTPQELLDAFSRTIGTYENNPGRLFQSATASSRETWNQGPFGRGAPGHPPDDLVLRQRADPRPPRSTSASATRRRTAGLSTP